MTAETFSVITQAHRGATMGDFLILKPYHREHGPKGPVTSEYIVLTQCRSEKYYHAERNYGTCKSTRLLLIHACFQTRGTMFWSTFSLSNE